MSDEDSAGCRVPGPPPDRPTARPPDSIRHPTSEYAILTNGAGELTPIATLEEPMAGFSAPTREDDPIHVVRTIGRLAQMLIELRDEYERRPRPDTLAQIDQRLNDLADQRNKLNQRRGITSDSGTATQS